MNRSKLPFKGVIFDLDGVVTSSAKLHEKAWGRMFTQSVPGVDSFSEQDYRLYVDGKPRSDGIKSFLEAKNISMSQEEMDKLAEIKQGYVLDLIENEGVVVFESTIKMIKELQNADVKLAIASSSKNASLILDKIGMREAFDVIVSNNQVFERGKSEGTIIESMKGKPEPDIFLTAAKYLGLSKDEVIGVEDAVAGVQAIKAADMMCVGINRATELGERALLETAGADVLVNDLSETSLEDLADKFNNKTN